MQKLRMTAALAISGALVLSAAAAGTASAGGSLVAHLSGANEVDASGVRNQGDPNAAGVAVVHRVSVAGANDNLCYLIVIRNIVLPATGAHIHGTATTSQNAGVLVPLDNPTRLGRSPNGMSRGCVSVLDTQLDAIWAHPELYYVNVHSTEKPAGAARGQLG